jgi:hypothetical protein
MDVLGRQFLRENRRHIPEFNFEKYGKLDEHIVSDEIEFATEDQIITGMETRGCPFSFLIDQINGVF